MTNPSQHGTPPNLGEEAAFGPVPRTVVEAMAKTLDFPERAILELLATVNEAALTALSRGGELDAIGFGHWQLRPWRARGPMVLNTCYGWDPIELPYPGRLDFHPAAALLRQLDEGELNTRAVFTCTPLLQTLMQRTGVPQTQAAKVMGLMFVTLTDLLLVEGFATIAGFGTLRAARRPTALVVEPNTGSVRPRRLHTVQFTVSPELLGALPSTHRALSWDTQPDPESDFAQILADDSEARPTEAALRAPRFRAVELPDEDAAPLSADVETPGGDDP